MIREWIALKAAGVPLTVAQFIGMALRRSLDRELVRAMVMAHRSRLEITPQELEAQTVAGGNVAEVVKSAMALKARGVPFDRRKLFGVDLARGDTWRFTCSFLRARDADPGLTFEAAVDRYLAGEWVVTER